jgi:catechol O-methyltransferase
MRELLASRVVRAGEARPADEGRRHLPCVSEAPARHGCTRRRVLLSTLWVGGIGAVSAAASAAEEDFYQRWPLVTPADVLPFLRATAEQGDAGSVVAALEAWGQHYPSYACGAEKGAILEQLVESKAPQLAVEVGSFQGYSAVRTARRLPRNGRLLCVEASPANAAVVRAVVDYAGLGTRVDVLTGLSGQVMGDIASWVGFGGSDWVFLDHCKPCLLPDTLRMEALGIIRAGTMVVADNVVYPGAPDYLQHVGDPRLYDTRLVECDFEYSTNVSRCRAYL